MTDPTEHAWSQEHVAAYVAGGLTALEAERLEAHARDCPACAVAVTATRRLDGGLAALFADVRPGPDLEDRVVHRLRTTPRRPLLAGWVKRTMAAAAAVIILGTVGAFVGPAMATIPLPEQIVRRSADGRVPITPPTRDGYPPPITEDGGRVSDMDEDGIKWFKSRKQSGSSLEAHLEFANPDTLRIGSYQVDQSVTADNLAHVPMLGYDVQKQNADGSVRGIDINGPYNGNLWGTFSGRSGATKELRLNDGGGRSVSEVAFSTDGKKLAGVTANPHYQSANRPVLIFNPAEHKPALAVNAQPPEQKTPAADPKVQPPDNPKPQPKDPTAVTPEPARRVILRSGEIEFEVDAFETASATIHKLVNGVKGAYVKNVSSDKLENGKMKGAITVRVPPEHLDEFVSALRKELDKNGGLKGVRIGSQDVTKQYYDIESRLKAARTTEQRFLQIIKEGKGDIKALVEAERELGVWRTKIEEFEGEIRYYNNLAALSTLTITLVEKEIRTAASLTERERVQAGVEVEEVEKAYQQVLAAVADAKGRVSTSEMKQIGAGQFNATINFEVAPDAAGPIRDRLNQLGRVARLEIDRMQQAEGGTTTTPDMKVKRGNTVFLLQLYNLANIAPRETATLQVAVVDVPTAYQALRDAVAKTTGRVLNAQLNEQDRQNVTAQFDFEVRRADEAAVRVALEGAGEVVARQVARAAEGESVTDTKVMYRVALLAANRLKPREVTTLGIEVADVDAAAASFAVQVSEAKGRPVDARTTREQNGRVVAKLVYEVPLSAAATLAERFKSAGTVRVSQSVRDPQASDGRFATARLDVTLSNTEGIVAEDAGVWKQVRRGLSYSASVLLTSVTWVVFGLCVVLPWAIIGYGGYRVARRAVRNSRTDTPTVPPGPAVA